MHRVKLYFVFQCPEYAIVSGAINHFSTSYQPAGHSEHRVVNIMELPVTEAGNCCVLVFQDCEGDKAPGPGSYSRLRCP